MDASETTPNASPSAGTSWCRSHRETVADDSPRGVHYPDDRTELAAVFDGESLRAICFDEREVTRYREETALTVMLTPAGECRIDGYCRDAPRRDTDPEQSRLDRAITRVRRVLNLDPESTGRGRDV